MKFHELTMLVGVALVWSACSFDRPLPSIEDDRPLPQGGLCDLGADELKQ